MDEFIRNKLEARFGEKEVAQVESLLEGFLRNSQVVVASIFLFASDHNKSFEEVLSECKKEHERSWRYQHPEIRGDPNAPGAAGVQNRASLENICLRLGIPPPSVIIEGEEDVIPPGAFIATTRNSIYRFGEADKEGKRIVSRDEKPLDFNCCRIIFLQRGRGMELKCFNCDHESWYTTTVMGIKSYP